eukprot:2620368-Amphidinium_carterae.1
MLKSILPDRLFKRPLQLVSQHTALPDPHNIEIRGNLRITGKAATPTEQLDEVQHLDLGHAKVAPGRPLRIHPRSRVATQGLSLRRSEFDRRQTAGFQDFPELLLGAGPFADNHSLVRVDLHVWPTLD